VGYRRGTQACLLIGVVLLTGCSANVSHPTALGTASSAPAVAIPPSSAAPPIPPSPRPAEPSKAALSASASPTSSGTPSSTGSASVTPTSANVIATHVRATARAFIDDFNVALATGDTTKIEALTSPTCGCRKLVNTIKAHSAKGERYDGVAFTLKSIDVTFLAAGASGEIKFSVSAGRILDATGTAVDMWDAASDGDNDLIIINTNGRWIVQQSYLLGASNQ
jgi:hypothetical protein